MFNIRRGTCPYTGRQGYFLTAYSFEIDPKIDALFDKIGALMPNHVTFQEGGCGWVVRRDFNGRADPSQGVSITIHIADDPRRKRY